MQIKKLNECIDMLKQELGKSLLLADIWSITEGISIANVNSRPDIAAKGNRNLGLINKMLKEVNAPPLGKYMLFDLEGGAKLVAVAMNDYCAAVIVDKDVQLGLFLHVVMPGFLDKFEEAVVA